MRSQSSDHMFGMQKVSGSISSILQVGLERGLSETLKSHFQPLVMLSKIDLSWYQASSSMVPSLQRN